MLLLSAFPGSGRMHLTPNPAVVSAAGDSTTSKPLSIALPAQKSPLRLFVSVMAANVTVLQRMAPEFSLFPICSTAAVAS